MRIFMTIVRVALALLAALVLFVTPLFIEGPAGRSIDTNGAIIDAVAGVVLIAMLVWMWVDRRNLA